MNKIYLVALGLLVAGSTIAQKTTPVENVGIGTESPDQSAVLDIQSTDKGLLIPRLSLSQRNSIPTPANGLMIYQINDKSGFYFFDGNAWKPLSNNDANSVVNTHNLNWGSSGNAGANPTTSFLGTTDAMPLIFKTNGTMSGYLTHDYTYRNTFLGAYSGWKTYGTSANAYVAPSPTNRYNTGFGYESLKELTNGEWNLAMGVSALENAVNVSQNVALGANTLRFASGSSNLAVGSNSLGSPGNSGSSNIGLGVNALLDLSTGSNTMAIGTNAGRGKNGNNNIYIGPNAGYTSSINSENNQLYIQNSSAANGVALIRGDFSLNTLKVNSQTTGYLAVGDFTTATSASPGTGGLPLPANIGVSGGYRLVVQDGILCEKVKVALRATGSTDWADYVFEPEYKSKMRSLEDVEKYILENKHLPNVPTTAEVQRDGIDIHQTSKMLLEKIEELTLYMIEMNKEIKELKEENAKLKK